MRSFVGLSLLTLSSAAPWSIQTIHQDAAPVIQSMNAETISDSYIVVFKKHVTESSAFDHHSWVHDIHSSAENQRMELRKRGQFPITETIFEGLKHTYNIAENFLGYSGHFDEDVVERIRRHPDVDYIEKDSIVHTMETEGELEKNAPWGLARISHREGLGFSTFNKYLYAADGGEGVDVYVIDTGTNYEHVDFEGRAHWGKTIPANDEDVDGNGHGTHCSGTIAGKKYGVAKKANVYAVKVLKSNGSGTMSDVVKGVEWAAESHIKKMKSGKKGFKGSTANMSLGGGKSPALDQAVNGAVTLGLHFAVAAGNDNADSCNYSPAAADLAVTVGASTLADERAYFSNFGKCNDIFAPGLNIESTWIGSKYATNKISGTSMASPHIAGLLAYYLSLNPAPDSAFFTEELTPKKLKANLISIGTKGALSDVPADTENILAWNGGGSSNYSSIIKAGSYTVKNPQKLAATPLYEKIENVIIEDSKSVVESAEKMSERLHKIIDEELEEFFDELHL